jgi:polyhydroxybutyrate depolymerase
MLSMLRSRRRVAWTAIGLVAAALLACGARARYATPPGAPSLARGELVVAGAPRTFAYFSPEGDGLRPAVIALHGRLGDGAGQNDLSHFAIVARDEGFVVVFPDGVSRSWNDARGGTPASRAGVDDVAFVAALVDWFIAQQRVDRNRVYIAGMSNGGFMTATLACELADRFAGAGVVAATVPKALEGACRPPAPVSVAFVVGDKDPLVPYGGGAVRGGAGGAILSAEASAKLWAAIDGCTAAPTTRTLPDADASDGTVTDVLTYAGCGGGSEVRLYTVRGGGHAWPGGLAYLPERFIGRTSRDFDASRELWRFFSAHSR